MGNDYQCASATCGQDVNGRCNLDRVEHYSVSRRGELLAAPGCGAGL